MTCSPLVVAVVVNYRTTTLTIACVDSLLRAARPTFDQRIVIVDNASGDDGPTCLRARWDAPAASSTIEASGASDGRIEVIELPANLGYAGGSNAGFARARALGARYALLLNSDTTLHPDCVWRMVAEAEADERVALVSPRIFVGGDAGGDERGDRLWFGGGHCSRFSGRAVHVGWGRPAQHGWQEPCDMSYATGCALLVRLEALDGQGFDASLFSYAEDLDLSLRLRERGWRIRYAPDAVVWHHEGGGVSHKRADRGGQALRFYLATRNRLRVAARHARWYHWPTLAPMLAIDVVGRFSAVALRDGDRRALVGVLRGAWHALVPGRHPIEHALSTRALSPRTASRTDR